MEIISVANIPSHFTLTQNGSDVAAILEYLGTDAVLDGYSYVFTEEVDGEITAAYGCYTIHLAAKAYPIL